MSRACWTGWGFNYPNTGWETWRQAPVGVTLNAGWNALRLIHLSRWAELDYIELA